MAATIKLAGDEIICPDLPLRKNKEWRRRALDGPLQEETRIAQEGNTVKESYETFVGFVDGQIEVMLELVLDYLPDQSRREYYADNATQQEVLKAFFLLAKEALSSDFFLAQYGGIFTTGSVAPPTGTSSPEASGVSG